MERIDKDQLKEDYEISKLRLEAQIALLRLAVGGDMAEGQHRELIKIAPDCLQTKTIPRKTVPDDSSSNSATDKFQPKERATEFPMKGKVTASATAHADAVAKSGDYEVDKE